MVIRRMATGDLARVAALSEQLGYRLTPAQIEERFRDAVWIGDSGLFVAETLDGTVAGWIHVVGQHLLETDPCAVIGGLIVDAGARRQGVGETLVLAAERWAREQGYGVICVRSNVTRVEARPFYEQLGFQVFKSQYNFRKTLK